MSNTTTEMNTIDRAGPDSTDWKLVVREGTLEMRKLIPYDGTRVYSTESRQYVSYRKSSRFNLSREKVVALYREKTGRDVWVPATVHEAVMERLHDADDPIGHAELVYQVEFHDGFDMGDVEDQIDALLDKHTIVDVAPEREGPAYEVA